MDQMPREGEGGGSLPYALSAQQSRACALRRGPKTNLAPPFPCCVHRFHLPRYVNGQPLQMMLKDRRRERYLLRLLVWHEELLADAAQHAQQAQRREA